MMKNKNTKWIIFALIVVGLVILAASEFVKITCLVLRLVI